MSETCPDCGRPVWTGGAADGTCVEAAGYLRTGFADAFPCSAATIAKLRARVSELEAHRDRIEGAHADLLRSISEGGYVNVAQGAWISVDSGDVPAMGALVAIEVPEMGISIGRVGPNPRNGNDRDVVSDEGYTYMLSECRRFCVLPAPPDAGKETT